MMGLGWAWVLMAFWIVVAVYFLIVVTRIASSLQTLANRRREE